MFCVIIAHCSTEIGVLFTKWMQSDKAVELFLKKICIAQGINLDNRHKDADDLLSVVLTQLESAKPAIELDQDDDKKHCEQFALNVFRKAQRKDESGIADRDTAKAYYAAFNFLEVRTNTVKISGTMSCLNNNHLLTIHVFFRIYTMLLVV